MNRHEDVGTALRAFALGSLARGQVLAIKWRIFLGTWSGILDCCARISLPRFKNVRFFRALAEKQRIKAACHNFSARAANKERRKIRIGSEAWLRSPEFLESASRDELKKSVSLTEGHIPDTILKVERARCLRAGS
jgi:hypothetical protein